MDTASGGVQCGQGHAFPIRDGYVDLASSPTEDVVARTLSSFGYEWTTFDRVQPEDERYWRWYFQDVPLDELAGGVGLDAGCGKGRYTTFTARHLGAMAALDGSAAVEAAARNLADQPHVAVVKADLRVPPFGEESFDFVSCLGVLHHLPDPEEGLRSLVGVLAPGGRLLLYVYSRPERPNLRFWALRAATAVRRVTVNLPHRLVRVLSAPLAALLYAGVVVPGAVGDRVHVAALQRLPLAVYRRQPLRSLWLDTFDRLTAPLEGRYTRREVETWFEKTGLVIESLREDAGLFVLARR